MKRKTNLKLRSFLILPSIVINVKCSLTPPLCLQLKRDADVADQRDTSLMSKQLKGAAKAEQPGSSSADTSNMPGLLETLVRIRLFFMCSSTEVLTSVLPAV